MMGIQLSMVQMNSVVGQTDVNSSKIVESICEAASLGSDIVCFPEACLTGYTTKGPDRHSLKINDPYVQRISRSSSENGIIVVFGFMENLDSGLYLTQMTVTPTGDTMVYRKTHLGNNERDVFSAGDKIPVISLEKVCLGVHLCWEGHIPDISTVLRAKGAELVLLPHCSGIGGERRKETWGRFLPARANDNGMYVAACNAVGHNGIDAIFGGGCTVMDPKGRVMAEYFGDDEHMLTCCLEGVLPRNGQDNDMLNISYFDRRRPELY
ncbi:MAG: hypothetical protein KRP56_07785 [Candidatus Methanogranum gryphiswaldense]|nr:MAG: hypothetical protein KRP56_07785 [Candidatus Methanogranum sp. U3.2.1]